MDRCPICLDKLKPSYKGYSCYKLNHEFDLYSDNYMTLNISNLYFISTVDDGPKSNIWLMYTNKTNAIEYLFTINSLITDFVKSKTIEQIISKIETLLVFR